MSKQDTGGPAFPVPLTDAQEAAWNEAKLPSANGMTLRDYFAAKALQGMASTPAFYEHGWEAEDMAQQSYMLADAMLKARKQ